MIHLEQMFGINLKAIPYNSIAVSLMMLLNSLLLTIFYTSSLMNLIYQKFSILKSYILNLIALTIPILSLWIFLKINFRLLDARYLDVTQCKNFVIAIMLVAYIAITSYGLANKNYKDIIFAGFYCSFSMAAISAYDYYSFFVAMEFMALSSAAIIYSSHLGCKKAVTTYLTTHLISGLIILVGIIILTQAQNSISIFYNNSIEHQLSATMQIGKNLILLGLLINIAFPPFSTWLTSSYPVATTVGSAYLITYTTKVAALYILLLATQQPLLLWLGIIMNIYGILSAVFASNYRKIICYMAIAQSGIILVAAGIGSCEFIKYGIIYITYQILYNSLIFITVGIFIDKNSSYFLAKDSSTNYTISHTIFYWHPLLLAGFIVGFIHLLAWPFTYNYIIKATILNGLNSIDSSLYYIYIGVNALTLLAIPFRDLYRASYSRLQLSIFHKFSILLLITALIIYSLVLHKYLLIIEIDDIQLLKNFVITAVSLALTYLMYNFDYKSRSLLLKNSFYNTTKKFTEKIGHIFATKIANKVFVEQFVKKFHNINNRASLNSLSISLMITIIMLIILICWLLSIKSLNFVS